MDYLMCDLGLVTCFPMSHRTLPRFILRVNCYKNDGILKKAYRCIGFLYSFLLWYVFQNLNNNGNNVNAFCITFYTLPYCGYCTHTYTHAQIYIHDFFYFERATIAIIMWSINQFILTETEKNPINN